MKAPPFTGALRPLFALALLLAAAQVRAQPSEEAVKAAFIPKFARYVQWPAAIQPGPRQPFHLCIIGRDPFGPVLDHAAASELVEGRAVIVRRLASPESAASCHLAFVRGATPEDTAAFLLALRNQPILTITDSRAGAPRGIIHFTVAGGRVRFFIDQAAATQRGISISSRLLALALAVRQRRT